MKRLCLVAPALLSAALASCLGASVASADITQTENLVLKTANTPYLRLDQTNASGFSPQTWDVAGNEANFFVRDLTGGSRLPFRIRPGAPTSSIDVAADGNVGIGTNSPEGSLEISRNGPVSLLYTTKAPNPAIAWATGTPASGAFFTIGLNGAATPALQLASGGNLALLGSLSEAATQASVANVQAVDPAAVLQKLAALPVNSWSFPATAGTRHLGPLAGDFSTAFGLGSAAAISPGDVAGVSLLAAKGLAAQNTALAAQVQSEKRARVKLGKKVGKLTKQMKQLRKAVKALAG